MQDRLAAAEAQYGGYGYARERARSVGFFIKKRGSEERKQEAIHEIGA